MNDDSGFIIVEKAARVLPRTNPRGLDARWGRTFFHHIGVNTFNQVEWENGHESPLID